MRDVLGREQKEACILIDSPGLRGGLPGADVFEM